MLTDVILWNYCNVWKFPSVTPDTSIDSGCNDGEWLAFGRVMDKVRAGGPTTTWVRAQADVVH